MSLDDSYGWCWNYFLRVIPTLIHYSDIVSGIPSGSHSFWHMFRHSFWHSIWHIFWHSFWNSIWYIFVDFLWLRSGAEHFDLELVVEVRQGTLWSGACGRGPGSQALRGSTMPEACARLTRVDHCSPLNFQAREVGEVVPWWPEKPEVDSSVSTGEIVWVKLILLEGCLTVVDTPT